MKYLLIDLLKLYKRFISPLLPQSCRFTPTCSEYAMEAVGKHGAVLGSWMSFKRLMRCQPFCEGGHDPVPGGTALKP
ncbi:MAG: membrane protein insertion efficiency factor YidD [Acidobacteriota bacterium]|nr:MAG: membrane protein insertion efficiency factor YidD [Acidobacteriota bacterium]